MAGKLRWILVMLLGVAAAEPAARAAERGQASPSVLRQLDAQKLSALDLYVESLARGLRMTLAGLPEKPAPVLLSAAYDRERDVLRLAFRWAPELAPVEGETPPDDAAFVREQLLILGVVTGVEAVDGGTLRTGVLQLAPLRMPEAWVPLEDAVRERIAQNTELVLETERGGKPLRGVRMISGDIRVEAEPGKKP